MKIETLRVDGFGVFRDVALETVHPRLTVFRGPNESGKSTLLAFLRFLFFGFPDKRTKANRYPPLHPGARHGGGLTLSDPAGRFCLERHDRFRLVLPDGSEGTEAQFQEMLRPVTREVFQAVFAFGLNELQALHEALDQGSVHDALYSTAAGLDHRVVAEAERYLTGAQAALFRRRGQKAEINAAFADLDWLQHQIRTVEAGLAAFDELGREAAALEASMQESEGREQHLQTEIRRLEDLNGWMERRRKRHAELERILGEQHDLRRRRAEVRWDAALLALAAEVRSLQRGRDRLVALREERAPQQQALEAARQALSEHLAILGSEWTPERIAARRPRPGLAEELAARGAEMQKLDVEMAEARATERAAAEARDAALEAELRAAAALEAIPDPPPEPAPELWDRLLAGRGDYERTTRDLQAQEAELRAAEDDLRRGLSEIDPSWTVQDLEQFDTSFVARQELERFRARFGEAALALERTREQVAQAEAEAAKADGRHRTAQDRFIAAPQPPCNAADFARCKETYFHLARRWAAIPRSLTPRWLPAAAGVLGVASGVALWFFLPLAGVLLAAAALASATWLWRVDRERQEAVEALEAELAGLCRTLGVEGPQTGLTVADAQRALDAAAEIFRDRDALGEKVEQAARELAEAEQVLARRRQALAEAESALARESESWARQARAAGLSFPVSPDAAAAAFSRVEVCRERLEKVRSLQHRIAAMERNREEYLVLLNDVLQSRGLPLAGQADLTARLNHLLETARSEEETREERRRARDVSLRAAEERRRAEDAWLKASAAHQAAVERLEQASSAWSAWLEQNGLPARLTVDGARSFLEALERASAAVARIEELSRQLQRSASQERELMERLEKLLAAAGRAPSPDPVEDLDALSAAIQAAEREAQEAAVLEARVAGMDRQIADLRNELAETDEQIERLGGPQTPDDIDARRAALERQLGELRAQLSRDRDRLAECRSRRQAMATDERLSTLYQEREARLEAARRAAREWAVLALARHLLQDARRRFEENRQPVVLRRASAHFQRLTGRRYQEVRMPLDCSGLQVLGDGGWPPKSVDQLSRGAAEQLYLALRFGFIEEFARDRSPLPVVMDDILVNFDPQRASAAIETLIQLSERFQILYFTCHPETAERFRAVDPSIPVVQLEQGRFVPPPAPG